MALPPGVTTCVVTYGKAVSYLGAEASISGTLTADRSIIHASTGWSVHSAADPVAATTGEEASFTVPHVDQAGFINSEGDAVTFWSYTFAGTVKFASGQVWPFSKTFQVVTGQETYDLDLSGDDGTLPGVALPFSRLQIGTVTTGAPGSAADADITGDGPLQSLDLTIPTGATGATGAQGTPGTGSVNLPELARNLVTNPSFEVNTTGWTAEAGGTIAVSTADKYIGAQSMLCTQTTTGAPGFFFTASGLTVGATYTFSAWVKRQAGTAGVSLTTGGGTLIHTVNAFASSPTAWTRLSLTFIATNVSHIVVAYNAMSFNGSGAAAGSAFYLDAVMLHVGAAIHDYFDGSMAGCYWTGTAHASASVKGLYSEPDVIETRDAPELARNLFRNPRFDSSVGNAYVEASSGGTLSYQANNRLRGTTTAADGLYFHTLTAGNRAAVIAGQRVHVGVDVTPSVALSGVGANGYVVIYWYDAAGVFIPGGTEGTPTSQGATTTRRWEVAGIAPAGAATFGIQINVLQTGMAIGSTIDIARPVFTVGQPSYTGYFDGDTPGARWTGARGSSESVKMLHGPEDHALLTWLDAGRAQGKGFPEGKVTAPVGTRYVDTLATNGAVEWTKMSGTGNTGWRVTVGDTGWRDISALVPVLGTRLVTTLHMRRVNGQVSLAAIFRDTQTNPFREGLLTPPDGFKPDVRHYVAVPYDSIPAPAVLNVYVPAVGSITYGGPTNGSNYEMLLNWPTPDPWPTTLPGTAV